MVSTLENKRNRLRRLVIGAALLVLLLAGVGYAWTLTPSYSLYQIKRALETHDYALFSYYVDVDSVLEHALGEFTQPREREAEELTPRSPLEKALRKGFKSLTRGAREIVKAGLGIAVEQTIKDRDHALPEIPMIAVAGALWQGQRDGDTVSLPVKIKKGEQIEVKMQHSPENFWRVIEISNLSTLLPPLKPYARERKEE